MSAVTDAIIAASSEPLMDSFYEDEPENEEEELRRTVAEIASNTDPEDLMPPPKEPIVEEEVEETEVDSEYNDPYPQRKHKSAEAEMQDRLLTIPLRPKNAPWGSLWVIHTGFIEQIALLNITKSEQKSLLRQWSDIQILAEGDGNKEIVESEQDEFVLKIVSYKSRSDNPEKGIRERTAHITNKTMSEQTINMPKGESQKSGFLNTILGRKT